MPTTNKHAKKAIKLHTVLGGKISIELKKPIKTMDDLAVMYTPGVGAVSAHIAKKPKDARTMTIKKNTVAVISDGSSVLGLGNIGPLAALPVMEGKAALFKRFAGVDAFPIVLDTQNVDEMVSTIAHIAPGFGGINLEDISAPRCFEVEARLKKMLDIPVLHDDQHGTAIVVLAGLINAAKVVKKSLKSLKVVIVGAGAAGQAIAELLLASSVADIILVDSKGVISHARGDLDEHKTIMADRTNPREVSGGLREALMGADVLIGVSRAGIITANDIKLMAKKPIVFAMANPVPEIMPAEAKKAGAAVIATGRSDFPNQINNVLAFPGLFRGALDHGVREITLAHELKAARAIASLVSRPTAVKIIPGAFDKKVVKAVSAAIR